MTQRVEAIYEGGVLRPLTQINGVAERAKVVVTVESELVCPKFDLSVVGTISDEDAAEMMRVIEEEFERIDPRDWQ